MTILIIKRDEWEFINLSKAYWAKVREIRGEKECVIALPEDAFYLTVPKDIDDKKLIEALAREAVSSGIIEFSELLARCKSNNSPKNIKEVMPKCEP